LVGEVAVKNWAPLRGRTLPSHLRRSDFCGRGTRKDAAANFDHDSDEVPQKRKRQAGGSDETLGHRRHGDFAESTDQEKRSDEESTDSGTYELFLGTFSLF
jgi:hypothetical protein